MNGIPGVQAIPGFQPGVVNHAGKKGAGMGGLFESYMSFEF